MHDAIPGLIAADAAPDSGVGDLPRRQSGSLDEVVRVARDVQEAIASVIEGKDAVIATAVTVFLADGHLLLEDVPGVGKTMLAKALAKSFSCEMRRIQFTPDLLPSDITGISIFNQATHEFTFRPGAVFANVVVCDEINRASPKTQSAVLESMEEAQVTVDGHSHPLPSPFLVIATQNPLEMEGTFPLPEAQRDRFMARLSMGYPSAHSEVTMLERHATTNPLAELTPVTDAPTIRRMIETIRTVHASPLLKAYVVDLVAATRATPALRLGASPRASLHLLRVARARAAMSGRDHVLPEDVRALFHPVLAHRVLLAPESQLSRLSIAAILDEVLAGVPVPTHPH